MFDPKYVQNDFFYQYGESIFQRLRLSPREEALRDP